MHVLSICKRCKNLQLTSPSLWLIRVGGAKLIVHNIVVYKLFTMMEIKQLLSRTHFSHIES